MSLCAEVAQFKLASGKKVYDKEREQQKLETVMGMAHGEFNQKAVGELFLQMMTLSRRYQYQLMAAQSAKAEFDFQRVDELPVKGRRIVFQGLDGAYGHAAALAYFGEAAKLGHVRRFEDLMLALKDQTADYAVMPIENSCAGAVTDNYDLLLKYDHAIVGEILVPVNHALLGTENACLSDIQRVYAHPQALMQSSVYLNENRSWQQISMENNAVAAKKIADDGDKSQAAVAGEMAGTIYGLKTLAAPINNERENTTRFLILSREKIYQRDAQTVSLCFELPHSCGSLYNMLANFIFNHVNMRKIESRPIPEKNWEYRFFVDIEGNLEDPGVINALFGVREEAGYMRILGNY